MAHDEDIFIKSTPRKVIMGYKVGLIETLTNVVKPFEVFGLKSSQIVPTEDLFNNSFGFLNGKNATPLGPWEVHTGENSSKVFEAISFKNQRYMLLALLCSAHYNRLNIQFRLFLSIISSSLTQMITVIS